MPRPDVASAFRRKKARTGVEADARPDAGSHAARLAVHPRSGTRRPAAVCQRRGLQRGGPDRGARIRPRLVAAMRGNADGELIQQNHLQLNSIAAGPSLRSSFFTASTDAISRRRPGHANFPVDGRGVVFSGATREPVAFGLTRPHSARLREGRIWLLNSGYGEFGFVDGRSFSRVATLPGWTRGLAFHGRFAFVGTSRVLPRFRQYAPGLKTDARDLRRPRARRPLGARARQPDLARRQSDLRHRVDAASRGEALPFVAGAPGPPRTLFYAYRPPGVRLPRHRRAPACRGLPRHRRARPSGVATHADPRGL